MVPSVGEVAGGAASRSRRGRQGHLQRRNCFQLPGQQLRREPHPSTSLRSFQGGRQLDSVDSQRTAVGDATALVHSPVDTTSAMSRNGERARLESCISGHSSPPTQNVKSRSRSPVRATTEAYRKPRIFQLNRSCPNCQERYPTGILTASPLALAGAGGEGCQRSERGERRPVPVFRVRDLRPAEMRSESWTDRLQSGVYGIGEQGSPIGSARRQPKSVQLLWARISSIRF